MPYSATASRWCAARRCGCSSRRDPDALADARIVALARDTEASVRLTVYSQARLHSAGRAAFETLENDESSLIRALVANST
jgi:hypothetical protein